MGTREQTITARLQGQRVPLVVKVVLTAFMCVLVPVYIKEYGPTNFLYFCDVSLFLALISVWSEWALPASMAAVGILLPQMLWVVDFLIGVCGIEPWMTAYMFSADIPLFARGLSLFHGWLPFFLVYLVWRLGYDRRAGVGWIVLAWGLMLVCYIWMPAPPAPADNPGLPVNIDYVYGIKDTGPQTWMPPLAWLALVMTAFPILFWVPTHLLLRRFAPPIPRPDQLPLKKD